VVATTVEFKEDNQAIKTDKDDHEF